MPDAKPGETHTKMDTVGLIRNSQNSVETLPMSSLGFNSRY